MRLSSGLSSLDSVLGREPRAALGNPRSDLGRRLGARGGWWSAWGPSSVVGGRNILWSIGAIHVVEALLLILVIFVGFVTGGQAESIGLALLFLAGRRSIRLLMLSRRCLGRPFVLVLVVVAAAVLVAAKVRAGLGLMKAAAAVMASAMAGMAIERRRGRHIGSWGRVALVGSRVLCRRSRRSAVGVWSAHWSGGWLVMVAIKSHPDRRTHQLPLGTASIIIATASTTSAAVRSVSRRRLCMRTPVRVGRTVDGLSRRVRLTVGRLRSGLVWGLGTIRRRLLLIDLRGIVGMIVLGGQRSMRCTLWRVLLAVIGVPLRLLLGRLGIAGLGRRARVWCGTLRTVGRLLAVAIAWVLRLVVATAIGATATSSAMAATRRTVRGITARAACGCWRGRRRRRTVVVRHGSSVRWPRYFCVQRKLVVSGQMEHWGLVDLPGAACLHLNPRPSTTSENNPGRKKEQRERIETGHNPAR